MWYRLGLVGTCSQYPRYLSAYFRALLPTHQIDAGFYHSRAYYFYRRYFSVRDFPSSERGRLSRGLRLSRCRHWWLADTRRYLMTTNPRVVGVTSALLASTPKGIARARLTLNRTFVNITCPYRHVEQRARLSPRRTISQEDVVGLKYIRRIACSIV